MGEYCTSLQKTKSKPNNPELIYWQYPGKEALGGFFVIKLPVASDVQWFKGPFGKNVQEAKELAVYECCIFLEKKNLFSKDLHTLDRDIDHFAEDYDLDDGRTRIGAILQSEEKELRFICEKYLKEHVLNQRDKGKVKQSYSIYYSQISDSVFHGSYPQTPSGELQTHLFSFVHKSGDCTLGLISFDSTLRKYDGRILPNHEVSLNFMSSETLITKEQYLAIEKFNLFLGYSSKRKLLLFFYQITGKSFLEAPFWKGKEKKHHIWSPHYTALDPEKRHQSAYVVPLRNAAEIDFELINDTVDFIRFLRELYLILMKPNPEESSGEPSRSEEIQAFLKKEEGKGYKVPKFVNDDIFISLTNFRYFGVEHDAPERTISEVSLEAEHGVGKQPLSTHLPMLKAVFGIDKDASTIVRSVKQCSTFHLGNTVASANINHNFLGVDKEFALLPFDNKFYYKFKLIQYFLLALRDLHISSKFKDHLAASVSAKSLQMKQEQGPMEYPDNFIYNKMAHIVVEHLSKGQPQKTLPLSPFQHYPIQTPMHHQSLQDLLVNIPVDEFKKALSLKSYSQTENCETLEFIGDSVLKLLASIEVFISNPGHSERALHIKRKNLICNAFLWKKNVSNFIFRYIHKESYNNHQHKCSPLGMIYQRNDLPEPIQDLDYKEGQFYVNLNGKSLADVLEALVGVIYTQSNNDLQQAQLFLQFLEILQNSNYKREVKIKSPIKPEIGSLFYNFQNDIKYMFRHPQLLLQAVTHLTYRTFINEYHLKFFQGAPSDDINPGRLVLNTLDPSITINNDPDDMLNGIKINEISYGGLEFLGDSLWDFVVLTYLNEQGLEDPERMTLMKGNLVNNHILALFALHFKLDGLLLSKDATITKDIEEVKKTLPPSPDFMKLSKEQIKAFNKTEKEKIKTLADVFESLLGALLIDLEFDAVRARAIVWAWTKPFVERVYHETITFLNVKRDFVIALSHIGAVHSVT